MNSLKMKIAVIFGVWQMSLGICLKGSNNAFNGQWVDFFFEFVPQIIIMLCMFGYMDMLIVWKWLTDYDETIMVDGKQYSKTAFAPSILSTMIDMFLNGGSPTIPTDLPIVGTTAQ